MAGLNNSGGGGGAKGIRAGKAYVEAHLDTSQVFRALERMRARFAGLGATLTKAGGGLAAAGGAVLAPLAALFSGATDRATQLDKLATKLGVPVEKLNEFAYAAEQTGITLEELEGHFENFAERVFQGAQGTGEAANSFKMLNLDAAKLKLENPIDQLLTLSDAMESVSNETERLGLLSSFGGDQFQKLNALFRGGSGNIRTAMGRAPTFADADVKQVREMGRAWLEVKLSLQAAILPLVKFLAPAAAALAAFVRENADVVRTVAVVGAGLVAGGAALAAFGLAMSGAASAVSLLVSPLGLLTAGVASLGYVLVTNTESGKAFFETMKAGFVGFAETARTAVGGISDAISSGNFQLAAQIAFAGVNVEFLKATAYWTDVWNQFKGKFVDGWHDLVVAVKLVFADLTLYIGKTLSGALNAVFSPLAGLAATLGLDELGNALKEFSRLDVGTMTAVHGITKDKLLDERRDRQFLANKAREDDLAAAQHEVDLAQAELDDLRRQAAAGAVRPGLGAALAAKFPTAARIADVTRGAFDASFASRRFGGRSLEKDIADNTKDTAKGVDAAVDELRGIASALRFR